MAKTNRRLRFNRTGSRPSAVQETVTSTGTALIPAAHQGNPEAAALLVLLGGRRSHPLAGGGFGSPLWEGCDGWL